MSVNGNGKPLGPVPMRAAVVNQGATIDLKQCIKDASVAAGKIVMEMSEEGTLAKGLEVATYQVAMGLLLEPIKAGIQITEQIKAMQAAQRAQGIVG